MPCNPDPLFLAVFPAALIIRKQLQRILNCVSPSMPEKKATTLDFEESYAFFLPIFL